MRKIIRKILENIVGTMGDIAFLTWNEKTSSKAKAERITTSIRSGNTPALAFAYSMDRQGCLSYPSLPKLTVLNFAYLSVNSVLSVRNRLLLRLTNPSMKDLLGLTISRSANHVEFQWELDSLQDDSYYVLCVAFAKGIQQVQIADVKRKKLSATVNLPQGAGEIITYTIAHRRTAS
jgi:hypothetical protein